LKAVIKIKALETETLTGDKKVNDVTGYGQDNQVFFINKAKCYLLYHVETRSGTCSSSCPMKAEGSFLGCKEIWCLVLDKWCFISTHNK